MTTSVKLNVLKNVGKMEDYFSELSSVAACTHEKKHLSNQPQNDKCRRAALLGGEIPFPVESFPSRLPF